LPERLFLVLLVLACVVAPGCSCSPDRAVGATRISACLTRKPHAPSAAPAVATVAAGTLAGTFSVTSTGEASYVMPLAAVPGRAGVEPRLAIAYDGGADGVVGAGFSLAGVSAIHRCAQTLAQDGEIRAVRY